ncbi:hypothetical protein GWI33_013432 [Rhynchophorus ferrugineus]|uniref:Uncharacterized protein n=1 Tax=Rhynchophorus ferrugineus TaxID=354439 RepID=A0A834I9N1_RHYFE|nr:hypothetical protein GWI33_013432 [Rhynchophorus ferrugineus]
MLCRARPLLNNDLLLISKHTPLINTIPINKFVEVQVIRQFRTNFSVNLVTKENNKNKDGTPAASSSDSDLTDDESDIEENGDLLDRNQLLYNKGVLNRLSVTSSAEKIY